MGSISHKICTWVVLPRFVEYSLSVSGENMKSILCIRSGGIFQRMQSLCGQLTNPAASGKANQSGQQETRLGMQASGRRMVSPMSVK